MEKNILKVGSKYGELQPNRVFKIQPWLKVNVFFRFTDRHLGVKSFTSFFGSWRHRTTCFLTSEKEWCVRVQRSVVGRPFRRPFWSSGKSYNAILSLGSDSGSLSWFKARKPEKGLPRILMRFAAFTWEDWASFKGGKKNQFTLHSTKSQTQYTCTEL